MIELVHHNPWFSVSRRVDVDTEHEWFRVLRPDSVIVVGTDSEGGMVFVEGLRDTTGSAAYLELPSGAIEPGELPLAAAARELREETGWLARHLEHVGCFVDSPGISSARTHVYRASVDHTGQQQLEPGEQWVVRVVPRSEVYGLIRGGRIIDGATIAAVSLDDIINE
ncbi:MAG: NUDIX hydrolase [Rhodoglobus sp.]